MHVSKLLMTDVERRLDFHSLIPLLALGTRLAPVHPRTVLHFEVGIQDGA